MTLRQRSRIFVRYAFFGLANNAFVYGVFLILINIGMQPVIASGLCYCLGLAIGYLVHRYWSFEATSAHARDIPRYIAAYLIGFVFSLALISLLLIWLPPAIAQLICVVATALVIFGSLTALRFGEGVRHADQAE